MYVATIFHIGTYLFSHNRESGYFVLNQNNCSLFFASNGFFYLQFVLLYIAICHKVHFRIWSFNVVFLKIASRKSSVPYVYQPKHVFFNQTLPMNLIEIMYRSFPKFLSIYKIIDAALLLAHSVFLFTFIPGQNCFYQNYLKRTEVWKRPFQLWIMGPMFSFEISKLPSI